MKRVNLREEVRQAIGQEWPAFAAKHPCLARVLDQDLLEEEAADRLSDDAEFRAAMDQAQSLGLGATVVADVVQRYLREFLERLM